MLSQWQVVPHAHLLAVFLALGVLVMQHDVTFYTKRGFDYKTAEYFASGRRKATAVKPLPDKSILVTFDNGEMRFYDMTPLICPGTVFAFLADEGAFERAYIDENHDIAWDIDPQVDSAVFLEQQGGHQCRHLLSRRQSRLTFQQPDLSPQPRGERKDPPGAVPQPPKAARTV